MISYNVQAILILIGVVFVIAVLTFVVETWEQFTQRRASELAELEARGRAAFQRQQREEELVRKEQEERAANWKAWKQAADQENVRREKAKYRKEIDDYDWKD